MIKKKRKFKVEIRKNCKICGGPLPTNRHRTYCSDKCRNRANYEKLVEEKGREYLSEQHRERLYKKSLKDNREKIQCMICGRWFRQVGSHVFHAHKMTAREYREMFGFDVKKGQLPEDLRKLFGEQALENGTYKNLKKGKKFWFKKGQEGVGIYERSEQTLERLRANINKTENLKKKHNIT